MISTPREWFLRGAAVFTPDGLRPASIHIRDGSIVAVGNMHEVPVDAFVIEAGAKMVLPGLVDTHVHINEPGRTDWEGFETATRAAAAGGVTTLIDMPLNSSPVTTTVAALNAKRAAAKGTLWVDVGFHGGIVPGNAADVQPLIDDGVCAFKAFLCHSGIDDFPNATEADLRVVMPILANAGLPLFVHAELVVPLPPEVEKAFGQNPRSYAAYLATRPPEWEVEAIELMVRLCRETRCHVHIVHLAASIEAWKMISDAKNRGLPLTVETCPHYLAFTAETIPDGDPRYKCAPPIRSALHADCLFASLVSNVVDTIGSDHSPAPATIKHLDDGSLQQAWGGIASLQLTLPVVWSEWKRRFPNGSIQLVVEKCSALPAALVGLAGRKGSIAPGFDADLVIFDPEATFTVHAQTLHHRHKATPYDGRTLNGVVETTFLRGSPVYHKGEFLGEPSGRTLKREKR
jgi:allantoinase